MRQLIKAVPQTFEVELTSGEVEYIRDITRNYLGYGEEADAEAAIRLSLFVGASRLLGYQVNDDGTQQFN